jgi:hypothetical protein
MLAIGWMWTLLAVPATSSEEPAVFWKGQRTALSALPAEVPAETRAAVAAWSPWAAAERYRIDLDPSGRVLLVGANGRSSIARQLALVRDTLAFFDERLPAAPAAAPAPEAPGWSQGPIPEDPESPPAGTPPSFEEALRPKSTAWGAGLRPLDRDAIVLAAVDDEADYASLLDHLARSHPYLAAWRGTAARYVGFTLEEPLCGAFVLGASGMEEWDPENELVHRTAELALLRRFGRQPYWVQQGWAWHVELSLRRSIYCFPYRSGFVGVGEHGGWDKDLRAAHPTEREPVSIADLAALRRGAWDDRAAKHAWGAIAFLDSRRRGALAAILADLHGEWDRGSRRDLGAGNWERDVDFELPLDVQARVLEQRAGATVWAELREHFAHGAPSSAHARH